LRKIQENAPSVKRLKVLKTFTQAKTKLIHGVNLAIIKIPGRVRKISKLSV
jgi:hypothetical protein